MGSTARARSRRVAYLPLFERGRAVRRARRASAKRPAAAPSAPAAQRVAPLSGMVEVFERGQVVGWVEAARGAAPVRVSMFIGKTEVVGTWAAAPAERSGDGDLREFRISLHDFWNFAKTTDRVSVRANGHPLPINSRGFFYYPRSDGRSNLAKLRKRLDSGEVFGQTGKMQLSKSRDFVWQTEVVGLYNRVRAALHESFGYDVFLVYGSLLGAVRENGFIGHDLDFDCGYISRHRSGPQAARELAEIAIALIDMGFEVESRTIALHVEDKASRGVRLDLFHFFFDGDGLLQFPFGVAGQSDVRIEDWKGTEQIPFAGSAVLIPANGAEMAEYIYGPSWRTPNPGFNWRRDRTKKGRNARVPVELGAEVYWSNFYAHTTFESPSTFFEMVGRQPDIPGVVVDLGCGEGRDSIAFARAGKRVLGIDRAARAIERATAATRGTRVSGHVEFLRCELGDAAELRKALDGVRTSAGQPVLFYARFVLHAIEQEAQATLLETIRDVAQPGDMLAAEFRTERDEATEKIYPRPFRRFLSGAAFAAELTDRYGFTVVLEQEGNGLARYRTENPYVCRVIARR